VKGLAALGMFMGVGMEHYLISAWLAVPRVLNTRRNSAWALYPEVGLSCLVKAKQRNVSSTMDWTCYPGFLGFLQEIISSLRY